MKFIDTDLEYYKTLEKIKKVTRYQPFEELHESVAGHCFLAVMLAYDIMDKYDLKLNKNRVVELLLFHDLSEIGMKFDFPADVVAKSPDLKIKKHEMERTKVSKMGKDFQRCEIEEMFNEFENKETRESLFANLIDKMESAIYILTNECAGFKCNEDFEFILHYPDKFVKHFPELKDFADKVKEGLQEHYENFKNKKHA